MVGSDRDDVIKGELGREQVNGHWRHFIQDSGHDKHYISCGSIIDVQVTQDGWMIPDNWTCGCFDERLVEPLGAYLCIKNPDGELEKKILPLGIMIRIKK